jgi:hypothetical protein
MHIELVEIGESSDNLSYHYFTQSSGKFVYYRMSQLTGMGVVAAGLLSFTLHDKWISTHKKVHTTA